MPLDPTNLLRSALGTAGVLSTRMRNNPNADELVDVFYKLPHLEEFYTQGLTRYGLDPTRLTVLKEILASSVAKEVTAEMFSVVLDDAVYLERFIKGLDGHIILTSGYAFSMEDTTVKAVFQNLSIGTARPDARVFKRYAHNNHLTRRALQEPDLFIGDALADLAAYVPKVIGLHAVMEYEAEEVDKITDLELWIEIPQFQLTRADGSVAKILAGGCTVPVTFDSKVVGDVGGIRGAFKQQAQLFLSDRVSKLVLPILADLARQGVTAEEKRAFLEAVLPGIFRHYVFVPRDFREDVTSLTSYYAKEMEPFIAYVLEPHKSVYPRDIDLVEDILLAHAQDHFGTGKFINRHSEMTYAWVRPLP